MSDDKKTEKKIASYGKNIKVWLDEIERNQKKLQTEENEKKQEKLKKKIENNKGSLKKTVEWLVEEGGNPKDFLKDITELQSQVFKDMFPSGADSDTVAIEKEIQRIKKMLNEDLKEAMEKYTYDPEEPIEEKRKNKLFYREHAIGLTLKHSSRKTMASGTPNKAYNDYWNYDRDYESTKDKYFSKEEQDLIINCLRSHEEEAAYLSEKRAWMGRLGESLCKTAEKIGEWGDITQARMWADNLSKEAFPKAVKDIEGRKLSKEELEEKSKAMTRRYIQFIGDSKAIEEAMNHDREAEAEAERLLNELRSSADEARPLLSGRDRREIEETLEAVESEVEGQGVLAYKLLEDKLGYEKALFIALYKHDSNKKDRRELLTGYSFEELGL